MRRFSDLVRFTAIWLVDFEYHAPGGEPPRPICMSGIEYWTREPIRLWLWDRAPPPCPFPITPTTAMVAYAAQAELSCFIALGWEFPHHVIDLFAEFRRHTNGLRLANRLIHALDHYGLLPPGTTLEAELAKKDEMIEIAKDGGPRAPDGSVGPFTDEVKEQMMDYCDSDVVVLPALLDAMMADPRGDRR